MLQFEFSGNDLPSAVAFVAGQCRNNTLPIYKHLLLIVDSQRGCLTIRGSNGGFYLSKVVKIDGLLMDGKVCVDAAKFADICRSLKSTDRVKVSFEQTGEKITGIVRSGRSTFKIACLDGETFPNPELCDSQMRVAFKCAQLRKALDRVNKTASSDSVKSILNSACIEFQASNVGPSGNSSDGICEIVASDGYRMTKQQIVYSAKGSLPVQAGMQMVVPKQQLGQLIAFLSQDDDHEIFMVLDNGRVAAIDPSEGWRFQFSLLEGQYPEWRRAIPQPQSDWLAVEVDRDDLAACLNRAQILAAKGLVVNLNVENGELQIATTGDDGTEGANEVVPATILQTGIKNHYKFNVRYLLQALSGLAGSMVRIALDGKERQEPD